MDYKLVLDFGNTLRKAAVFHGDSLVELQSTSSDIVTIIELFRQKYPQMNSAILSTVVHIDLHLLHYLKQNFQFLLFDHETKIPINNAYKTPVTLGKDRIAAAIGAFKCFPNRNVLIIDAGSSITYEILTKDANYLGGAISLGIHLRAKALNHFTDQLPLVEPRLQVKLVGDDTESCLQSGIVNGAIAELSTMIQAYENQFSDLKIILTGGDAIYFEKSLKYDIFASENLVLEGLNYILDYNDL
ncbi:MULTISPECIES: type III pantothenate kinase [unclassified Lentimicrobium]|uniref:type III pantothenate kinase n=1 Tax=unclassified Lentimicrobium TaxID=2677434 RepID=UPI00155747E4|nr:MULTISPECIES: type III pantothenate kinase [unclassified Lentimicrobium]NPD44552.1 type III pantothenate kinase [Lentimicrobium sp. S6]NPD85631.1 type III pantothenate kinase [Lentimicrobium sp. L6]